MAKAPVISFIDGENGNVDDKTPVEASGNKVPALPSVTPDAGYEFDHWEDEDGNTITSGQVITRDTTLSPICKKNVNEVTVTFESGYNGSISEEKTITVESGTKWSDIDKPETTEGVSASFAGWYADDMLLEDSSTIDENTVAVAKFNSWFTRNRGNITGLSDTYMNCNPLPSDMIIPEYIDGVQVIRVLKDALKTHNGEKIDTGHITYVEFAETLWTIAEYSCSGMKNLRTAKLPTELQEIPTGLFYGCRVLESVEMPDTTTNIEASAFYYCDSLKSIEIPSDVSYIGANAFSNCRKLTSVKLPDTLTFLGDSSFAYCTSLQSIVIPEKCLTIWDSAFAMCESLTSAKVPSTLIEIPDSMFQGCTKLSSINFPSTIETIGKWAFTGAAFRTLTINEGCKKIGEAAFANNAQMTKITLPSTIEYMDSAFDGCTVLNTITIKKSRNSLSGSPWGAPNTSIDVNWAG